MQQMQKEQQLDGKVLLLIGQLLKEQIIG